MRKNERRQTLSALSAGKKKAKKSGPPTKATGGFGKKVVAAAAPAPKEVQPSVARRELGEDRPCPCHLRGSTYGDCCKPYLEGDTVVPDAEWLLPSRYSAFSLANADYIVDTTHRTHSDYDGDRAEWKERVLGGLDELRFVDLDIKKSAPLEAPAGFEAAHRIHFSCGICVPAPGGGAKRAQRSTVTEISTFLKEDGRWYYSGGVVNPSPDAWDDGSS